MTSHCQSTVVRRRRQRTVLGYRRFSRVDCQRHVESARAFGQLTPTVVVTVYQTTSIE